MPNSTDPIMSKIKEHGWAVVNVEGDAGQPAYSYSVGLYETFSHPEVIAFGLASPKLQGIINAIGKAVKAGERFTENDLSNKILSGYRCAFRRVAPAAVSSYMGFALERYGGDVPVLHCIWPDAEGRFPWERGTAAEFRGLQPMLSDGPEPHTHTRPGGNR